MPGLTVSGHAWGGRSGDRFIVYNTEKPSQVCEMHLVYSYPTWPSRWGKRISKDWPRLKSCQAVCDECMRGEICSGQSLDAGCLRSWGGRVSLKFGVHFVIVLFLFATMGFHIARLGFFGPQWSCYKGSLLYIARPLGWGMGCLLWIQHLVDILPQLLQSFMQYLIILDRVITALDCILYAILCYTAPNTHHCIKTTGHMMGDMKHCETFPQLSSDNLRLSFEYIYSYNIVSGLVPYSIIELGHHWFMCCLVWRHILAWDYSSCHPRGL